MNIYIRYFDHEEVFPTAENVIAYLEEINDFPMTQQLRDEINHYAESNMPFPKRVKVRQSVYFIMIKTTETDLAGFKANRKNEGIAPERLENSRKAARMEQLQDEKEGWYKGSITFKRVILIPGTQKCQYYDTRFSAYVYATSGIDCYNRIIDHLKNRQDVDLRSQFPSARGANFSFSFVGDNVPLD